MKVPTFLGGRMAAPIVSLLVAAFSAPAMSAADKPNILVIWGDDIGWSNISAYHRGMRETL